LICNLIDHPETTFKLGDFGLLSSEKDIKEKWQTRREECLGDGKYLPGEIISCPTAYNDVFALGLSAIECMIPQLVPNPGKKSVPQEFHRSNFSDHLIKIICRILDENKPMLSSELHSECFSNKRKRSHS